MIIDYKMYYVRKAEDVSSTWKRSVLPPAMWLVAAIWDPPSFLNLGRAPMRRTGPSRLSTRPAIQVGGYYNKMTPPPSLLSIFTDVCSAAAAHLQSSVSPYRTNPPPFPHQRPSLYSRNCLDIFFSFYLNQILFKTYILFFLNFTLCLAAQRELKKKNAK